jgi:hypothetical protein
MLSFSNNNLANEFMTKEDIAKVCPMALRTAPTNPKVSERYVFANTETVIDDLAKLGWYPVEAKQCRAKSNSAGVRSFHMLAFQNPNFFITKNDGVGGSEIECYPRIILTNSHDGFNSFRFMVGLFRLVCSNGLVIATDQMADIHIRHIAYDFDELRKVVVEVTARVREQVSIMQDMQDTILTQEQKVSLAVEAIKIRNGAKDEGAAIKPLKIATDAVEEMLTPVRHEDIGDTLWNVFNVIQEHMMTGGYQIVSPTNGRIRKARALKSVAKGIDYNKALFGAASRLIATRA